MARAGADRIHRDQAGGETSATTIEVSDEDVRRVLHETKETAETLQGDVTALRVWN